MFYTTASLGYKSPELANVKAEVTLLQLTPNKQRINEIKKKHKKGVAKPYFDTYKVKSYATADFYDLDSLSKGLIDSGAYEIIKFKTELPDNCLCAKPKYPEINEVEPRHIFFFEEGTVVFWNISSEEQNSILELIHKHSELFYTQEVINEESEYLSYSQLNEESISSANSSRDLETRLDKNHIYFTHVNIRDPIEIEKHLLEKYSFSDAISLSVQLG